MSTSDKRAMLASSLHPKEGDTCILCGSGDTKEFEGAAIRQDPRIVQRCLQEKTRYPLGNLLADWICKACARRHKGDNLCDVADRAREAKRRSRKEAKEAALASTQPTILAEPPSILSDIDTLLGEIAS